MPAEITMPQLSDTMSEGTVVKWHKKEGDKVKIGEKIADVETDKAVMEMESFDNGTLATILVKEGEKVAVGAAMAVLATGKENPADIKKPVAAGAVKQPTPPNPIPPKSSTAAKSSTATLERASSGEIHEPDAVGHGATREPATPVPPIPGHSNGEGRVRVSPLARRIAKDKNVDLAGVNGSGPGGRIVAADVENFKPAPAKPAAPAVPLAAPRLGSGEKQLIELTKMRSAIAKSLVASKQNVPHFYETIDVDVEDLSVLRAKLNEVLEPEKVRLSLGDFIAKAVASVLLRHPALNATFNGTEITRYGDVHLGMAVSIPDGLIVPVLRNIHQMGLKEIRQRSVDLVDRARGQRLKQEEMSGATFTVSNLGTYGIREFSAIINPPQVAILAIASAEKRAVVRNDQVVARTMMTLTLSADHRVVDGAVAADFLRTLKNMLEEPGMMLV